MCNIQSTYATYQCVEQSDCNIPRKSRRRDGIIWSPTNIHINIHIPLLRGVGLHHLPKAATLRRCQGLQMAAWAPMSHHSIQPSHCQVIEFIPGTSSNPPHLVCRVCLALGLCWEKMAASIVSRPISKKKNSDSHSRSVKALVKSWTQLYNWSHWVGWMFSACSLWPHHACIL